MDHIEVFLSKCYDGDLSAVQGFLLEGISPNIQNAEGETALQISAANGFSDIVNVLLKKGAFVDLPNNYGWTPLMHAARHGHFEVVSFLIHMKAKVNVSNKLGLRPIDVAAWSGNLSCVKLIMEAGAIIDSLPYSDTQSVVCDFSPLMTASLRGHDFILRLLLEKESAVNQASPITGLTPLMLAACNGYKNIVEILIEFGGDANKIDKCGQTALDLAVVCCKKDVIDFLEDVTQPNLRKSSGGVSNDISILRVVRSGDIAQVKFLLQQNQSLCNYTDPADGVSPLMIACMLGFNNIVDVLMCNGANLNAQDVTNGWTPLMYAVFHRQAETVHLLLDKGVNVDICTANGYTAIDLAIHTDSSETDILGLLLAYTESQEISDAVDYSASSPNSTIRRSHLGVEKMPTRSDSQGKFKDLFGGLSSHLRQFSKSSAISPSIEPDIFDETLNDVFEDDTAEKMNEGKFLCISKFYAPNERFAHLLKEQEVEAINLPSLPCHAGYLDGVKTIGTRKDKANKKNSPKMPCFNSLCTPNLLKKYLKNDSSVCSSQLPETYVLSDSLDTQDFRDLSTQSVIDLKLSSQLQSAEFDFKEKNTNNDIDSDGSTLKDCVELGQISHKDSARGLNDENFTHKTNSPIETTTGGLTALLSQGSLKKYAEKFRDQEIDLETFQYLTEDDLNEIGINSFESRNKLMKIIGKLKNS